MKIGVISDSHDHVHALIGACGALSTTGITTALHLGDFCAPFMVDVLTASGLQWYGVFGNNDGPSLDTALRTLRHNNTVDILRADFRELELDGRKLFLTHYPQIARIAAISGQYDAVFHGHTHIVADEVITTTDGSGSCPLYNPGELCGTRFGQRTYMVFDTDTLSATVHTM
jgi:uncharacterized protein